MRKILLLACSLSVSLTMLAQDFEVDGIKYSVLDADAKICEVAGIADASITKLVIPSKVTNDENEYSVKAIAEEAFFYKDGIKSVEIGDGVEEIGEFAFCWCLSLSDINFGNTVSVIGENAFNTCSSLVEVTLPESLTTIKEGAFMSCKNLTDVTIPASVEEIEDDAFSECPNICNFIVSEDNKKYHSVDGVLLTADMRELLMYPCGNPREEYMVPEGVEVIRVFAVATCNNLKKVTLSSTVTELMEGAFYTCESLESVVLNEGLKSIGRYAFASNTALTEVEIPSTVTNIVDGAFMSCELIEKVTLGEGVETIDQFAFYGCEPLSEIVIPANVKTIGMYAFDNCNLTKVTSTSTVPPVCSASVFASSTLSDAELIVPDSAMDDYKAANVWKDFANISGTELSGVAVASSSGVSIEIFADGFSVIGADDVQVYVYNLSGILIYEGRENNIYLPRGLYIVKTANKAMKVNI